MQCRISPLNADEPGVARFLYVDLGGLKRTPHARLSQPPSPRLATASTTVAVSRLPACIQLDLTLTFSYFLGFSTVRLPGPALRHKDCKNRCFVLHL